MHTLERLDTAINAATSEGNEVVELDLTNEDYADLMRLAADFSPERLDQLQLDLVNQTYRGYPLVYDRALPQSAVLSEIGAEALPDNSDLDGSGRITVE